MYLSVKERNPLDNSIKAFEVAYRSYCADKLLVNYSTADKLAVEIISRLTKYKASNAIMGGSVFAELSKQLVGQSKDKLNPEFWDNIIFARNCYINQEQIESHDVSYLKTLNCLVYLFADLFSDVIRAFSKPELFISASYFYYDVRNALSHPASTLIKKECATQAVEFMKVVGAVLPYECFWYCSWHDIQVSITQYEALQNSDGTDEYGLIWNNISEIPFPEHAIVCREKQIESLYTWICGWNGQRTIRNTMHSVCISGYGGVGKTALVAEFISRLLNQLESGTYKGTVIPKFILFYSAKTDRLDADVNNADLFIRKIKSQFSSFSELKGRIESDLDIDALSGSIEGIIVIDNLESLNEEDRIQIMEYIDETLPRYAHVIITTRIPEVADRDIKLSGFQNEEGSEFVREYIETNNLSIRMDSLQVKDLVRFSYGNTLILVLALRRIDSGLITIQRIIQEMKKLPKNDGDKVMASFMYQNTVDELFRVYSEKTDILRDVLCYFCVCSQELTADIIASASKKWNVDEVNLILGDLAKYLVIDLKNDKYSINQFAKRYILVKTPFDSKTKTKKLGEITAAYNQVHNAQQLMNEKRENSKTLSNLLREWGAATEGENVAISEAFGVWERRNEVSYANPEYGIQLLRNEIERIQKINTPHPFVFHQWARILIEFKLEGLIQNEYDSEIEEYYNKCFLMIDTNAFEFIKSTRTYPAIQRKFAQFLLESGNFTKAVFYCDNSVANYRKMNAFDDGYYEVLAMYAYVHAINAKDSSDFTSYKNAKSAMAELRKNKELPATALYYRGQSAACLAN